MVQIMANRSHAYPLCIWSPETCDILRAW